MPINLQTTNDKMTQRVSHIRWLFKASLFLLMSLACVPSQAQKTKRVTGEGVGYSSDIVKAREMALFEAKKDALKEAGVYEAVKELATVYTANGDGFSQTYSEELSFLMIDGKVKLIADPVYADSTHTVEGIVEMHCSIRAEVVIEEQVDPEFDMFVGGFKQAYHDGDEMTFSFISSKDCYMRLFYFDHGPGGGLYGNMDYPDAEGRFADVKFRANTEIKFPSFYGAPEALRRSCKWTAYNSGSEPIQTTYILIVVLKRQRPFLGEVTYDRVIKWLWKIPADERCVHWQAIQIVKSD